MQILVGEWPLVFGLDWLMPSNAKEARAEKKRHSKDDCVYATSSAGRHLGFHPKIAGKAYAAALIVGIARPNAVICQNLDETTSWVCFLDDGVPMAGSDRILPTSDAQELARGWHNDDPTVELVGDIDGARVNVRQVLDDVHAGLGNGTVARNAIERTVVGPTGWTLRRAALVGAVAITLVVSYLGYENYTAMMAQRAAEQMSLEEVARAAVASERERARIAARQRELRVAFDKQVAEAQDELSTRIDPASLWSSIGQLRANVPISLHGYRPQGFECTTSTCAVTWLGQGRFTRAADKLSLPNVERNLSADLTAVSNFEIETKSGALPLTAAQSPEELALLVNSDLMRYGASFTVGAMSPVTVTPPSELRSAPAQIGATAKWSVQFSGPTALVQAAEMIGSLSRWPTRLTAVKYQRAGGAVALEGEIVYLAKGNTHAN